MNKFEIIWIAVVMIISGVTYLEHGNDSITEIWRKGCKSQGMELHEPDLVEVLQGRGDFICLPASL